MAPHDDLLSKSIGKQKPNEQEEEDEPSWKEKPLHGVYHRQIEEVANLRNGDMRKAGEGWSQRQRRSIEAEVCRSRQSPRCKDATDHSST